jgi:hypothetical protein
MKTMEGWQIALIIGAFILVVVVGLLAYAGLGSVESSTGQVLERPLNGTPLEQSAVSLVSDGNERTQTANSDLVFFIGLIFIGALIYFGES